MKHSGAPTRVGRDIHALFCKRAFLQKLLFAFFLAYTLTLIVLFIISFYTDGPSHSTYDAVIL
jgi:hypothetical protein